MTARPSCYGAMFPDLTHLRHNTPCTGKAFTVVVQSSGIGVQGKVMTIDRAAWENCQQCSSYASCYDLCMANLALGRALYHETGIPLTEETSLIVD